MASTEIWATTYIRQAENYAAHQERDSFVKIRTRMSFALAALTGIVETTIRIAPTILMAPGALLAKAATSVAGEFSLGRSIIDGFKANGSKTIGAVIAAAVATAGVVHVKLSQKITSSLASAAFDWDKYKVGVVRQLDQLIGQSVDSRLRMTPVGGVYRLPNGDKPLPYYQPVLQEIYSKIARVVASADQAIHAPGISSEEKALRVQTGLARVQEGIQKTLGRLQTLPITYADAVNHKLNKARKLKIKALAFMDEQFRWISAAKKRNEPKTFDQAHFSEAYAAYRAQQEKRFDEAFTKMHTKASTFKELWTKYLVPLENKVSTDSIALVEGVRAQAAGMSQLVAGLESLLLGQHLPDMPYRTKMQSQLKAIYASLQPRVKQFMEAQKLLDDAVARGAMPDIDKWREAYNGIVLTAAAAINQNKTIVGMIQVSVLDGLTSELQWFLNPAEGAAGAVFTPSQKLRFQMAGKKLAGSMAQLTQLSKALHQELAKQSPDAAQVQRLVDQYAKLQGRVIGAVQNEVGPVNTKLLLSVLTRALVVFDGATAYTTLEEMQERVMSMADLSTAEQFTQLLTDSLQKATPSVIVFSVNQAKQWVYRLGVKEDLRVQRLADLGLSSLNIVKERAAFSLEKTLENAQQVKAIMAGLDGAQRSRSNIMAFFGNDKPFNDFNWQAIQHDRYFKDVVKHAVQRIGQLDQTGVLAAVKRWFW